MTPRLGRRIAFINNKGGVGKTTIAREVGAALARNGRRVLLVDVDPQANLTRRLGVTAFAEFGTLTDVLTAPVDKGAAAKAIVPCGWQVPEAALIDVLPADLELRDRDREAAEPFSHVRLVRAMFGVSDDYDYTIYDCRPTLGHLEQLVVASLDGPDDGVYIPIEPGHDAISGAVRVLAEVAAWSAMLGDAPVPTLGVIVNHVRTAGAGYVTLHADRIEQAPETLGRDGPAPPILRPYIPERIAVAEAQDQAVAASADRRMDREGLLSVFDRLAVAVDR